MQPAALLPIIILGTYLSIAALERFPALRFAESPFFRRWFGTDLTWQLFTLGIPLLARPLLTEFSSPALTATWERLPFAVTALAAVLLYDGAAFSIHVLLHRFDTLWTIHKVHHSSRTLDWLATTRQHLMEGFLRNVPTQAVLFLAGFPLEAIVVALGVYASFAVLGHSNLRLRLRWIEPLFVTPRIHRRHHVPETTDKNFGTIFTLWDRLAGSLVVRDTSIDEPLGVPDEVETYPQSFRGALTEPFRTFHALARSMK